MCCAKCYGSVGTHLYQRLQHAAAATKRPLVDVLIRADEVGSPPHCEDAPAEFRGELAALESLDDEGLWRVARERRSEAELQRWQELLDKKADGVLLPAEVTELAQLRTDADRLTLRKAQAAALLRWRGHPLPPTASFSTSQCGEDVSARAGRH